MPHVNVKQAILIRERSPYLLQHAIIPLTGSLGKEAFAKAKTEDSCILSTGTQPAIVHVMAHESLRRRGREALNRGFVAIKVDKEERPDIDAVYMSVWPRR